jgi:hypothetical protein
VINARPAQTATTGHTDAKLVSSRLKPGSKCAIAMIVARLSTKPIAAPVPASIRLPPSNRIARLPREAPRAIRTAISRSCAAERATSMFASEAHASNSRHAAVPRRISSAGLNSPASISRNGVIRTSYPEKIAGRSPCN